MPKKTTTPKPSRKTSLVGLFGHTYIPDPEKPDQTTIQYQFGIIRPVPPGRWLVQYFSYWDGRPTNVAVYPESFLLSDDVRLYLDHAEWRDASDRHNEVRSREHAWQREQERQLKNQPMTAAEPRKLDS